MAHYYKGSALVPDQQERTGLLNKGYGLTKALYSCGLTALPPNGGWRNGRYPVEPRSATRPNRTCAISRQHVPTASMKHSLAAPGTSRPAVMRWQSRRPRACEDKEKALRRASKRHRSAPDQPDRGRPKQPRHQITSPLPESAACGSPLRRAYRPYGAVAEWLKAAVC
jgi:hypothetical protein